MNKTILIILVLTAFCLSTQADDSINVIEEKIITMSNPDWWNQVSVERPDKYDSHDKAIEQLNLVKKEINGKKKEAYQKDFWPKYQIKAYIYVAGTYKKNHSLRAEAFCSVGELYREIGDIKRANTAYYNSIAQLKLSEDSPRKKELLEFCNARVLEMENLINDSNSSVLISEEK